MKKITKIPLPFQIIIGLFIGVILGLYLGNNPAFANTYIKPFGIVFLDLINL